MNVEQGEEGKPVIFTANVQVRPEVTLGDYRGFNFKPEIETIDEAKVQKVVDELRDQNASLGPVDRPRREERRLRGHRLHGQPRRRPVRGRLQPSGCR